MVVVDRLSKYGHFIPLKHPYTARAVSETFIREIIRLHGLPKTIVTDRDKVFTSQFWRELFKAQGSKLRFSSAYHPQTDGQIEAINKILETYLRCFSSDAPKQWYKWLAWAELSYNTKHKITTGVTPYETVYGREPPNMLQYLPGTASCNIVDNELTDRDTYLKILRQRLEQAQARMKKLADRRRTDRNFNVGQYVFLKLQSYRQGSVQRRNQKISARYFGPYKVTEKVGKVAYRLLLPEGSQIHDVFHVSQLKEKKGEWEIDERNPGYLLEETEDIPERVLEKRIRKKGAEAVVVWLVQWRNKVAPTWEEAAALKIAFPIFFQREVALGLPQGAIVTTRSGVDGGDWAAGTNGEDDASWEADQEEIQGLDEHLVEIQRPEEGSAN